MRAVLATCLLAALVASSPIRAGAQSATATLSGIVSDAQQGAVLGATITLKNLDTGETPATTSDARGQFRIIGLTPGRYELRIEATGFVTYRQPDLTLAMSEQGRADATLSLASVTENVTVRADVVRGETPIALGRTFMPSEIEQLPVFARDFANLATLTAGIGTMPDIARTSGTGITAAGQTGRNNTFLIDGLTLDDLRGSNVRGGLPLDSIKEFMVLSNAYSAEYGQASGAIVNVLTRSGTNRLSGRLFYYHRDDAWDATYGGARLASPPEAKAALEQVTPGGLVGGPVKRDRLFFFGAFEHSDQVLEQVVTSEVLDVFRPGAPHRLTQSGRTTQVFGRGDGRLGHSSALTLRYRLDTASRTNQTSDAQPAGLIAPERRVDTVRRSQDFSMLSNSVRGSTMLNEFRFQVGRRYLDNDPSHYCPGCFAENGRGILLGKSPIVPAQATEDRAQVMNALTWQLPNRYGDHSLKAGVDVSVMREQGTEPAGFDGIFTFATSQPFNPADPSTYPIRYLRNAGDPVTDFHAGIYAVFLQDEWMPTSHLTLNLGVRWDYEDAPGIAHDRDNIAPRLGAAVTPWKNGRTSIRGSYGAYYDQLLLIISSNALRADATTQILFANPGYPNPFGPNPNRPGGINTSLPSTTRFSPDMATPLTEQGTIGVQHTYGTIVVAADGVWARGRHLLRSRDLNYPDITNPNPRIRPRPDPTVARVLVREAEGHSWYRALQASARKRHSMGYSYALAYTWSSSERDTEDFEFLPQDQRNYGAERGPAASDARHRLSASVTMDLPLSLRLATLMTARSGLPYTVTTGADDNADLAITDRPPGESRNSQRGDDLWQIDARLSRSFRTRRLRFELLVDVFNVANHRNWTGYDGVLTNPTFRSPTGATSPREIQVGIRVDF